MRQLVCATCGGISHETRRCADNARRYFIKRLHHVCACRDIVSWRNDATQIAHRWQPGSGDYGADSISSLSLSHSAFARPRTHHYTVHSEGDIQVSAPSKHTQLFAAKRRNHQFLSSQQLPGKTLVCFLFAATNWPREFFSVGSFL
jgi:hypothetical protein